MAESDFFQPSNFYSEEGRREVCDRLSKTVPVLPCSPRPTGVGRVLLWPFTPSPATFKGVRHRSTSSTTHCFFYPLFFFIPPRHGCGFAVCYFVFWKPISLQIPRMQKAWKVRSTAELQRWRNSASAFKYIQTIFQISDFGLIDCPLFKSEEEDGWSPFVEPIWVHLLKIYLKENVSKPHSMNIRLLKGIRLKKPPKEKHDLKLN